MWHNKLLQIFLQIYFHFNVLFFLSGVLLNCLMQLFHKKNGLPQNNPWQPGRLNLDQAFPAPLLDSFIFFIGSYNKTTPPPTGD